MNKKIISLAAIMAALGLSLGIYAGNLNTTPETPQDKAVAQLLAKTLPDSAGKPQALNQWQHHFLVVNFWATWCAPCVQEMPELSALQKEFKGKSTQIIGLGIDSPSNIAEFTKKYNISYPLYVAGMDGSELSRQMGNQAGGLPFTILINADGKVVKSYLGRLKMDELRADITKFSAEKSK
ncbi:TlpA family protein disulfide reductase [Undibacterium jejuense]|uniref:TlpA family protein disulfide reductase n=2 Tax=Undibacterium jejuense TaxID=1344949 RepID=A0A923HDI2_9BURK|nr:TlpA disulfide reductase family protein [Undibacterium jejuense]MBC3861070.1 TlpA family protein disulfide reductase [Undibacterium jejuense]